MISPKRVWQVLRAEGISEVAARASIRVLPPRPLALADVLAPGVTLAWQPEQCLEILAESAGKPAPSREVFAGWLREWEESVDFGVKAPTEIPAEWNIEKQTSILLYCLVRWHAPQAVLETGIARGASSLSILRAMERNGHGRLFSVDVMEDVGILVPEALYSRWSKTILDPEKAREEFLSLVQQIKPIDIFFHDSDHNERWMAFEFAAVTPMMADGGIFASDDVHQNRSYLDAVGNRGECVLLLDTRKASGFSISRHGE